MLKPIIEDALDKFDFEQLDYIRKNNMFEADENVDLTTIPVASKTRFNVQGIQEGQFCKLYYDCKTCGINYFYQEFLHNINWRKNKNCKNCCGQKEV